MRVYQFRHVGLVLQSSLDVAVEFRYDIRLCRFALDQLSFGFCAGRILRSILAFGWAVCEESESIADEWQKSKSPRKDPAARLEGRR